MDHGGDDLCGGGIEMIRALNRDEERSCFDDGSGVDLGVLFVSEAVSGVIAFCLSF